MSYRKIVELESKDTLGYKESEDKKSFMRGVGVAISLLEKRHEEQIKNLQEVIRLRTAEAEEAKKDLIQFTRILNKYVGE